MKAVSWVALTARKQELEAWLDDADPNHPRYRDHCAAYATVLEEIREREREAKFEDVPI